MNAYRGRKVELDGEWSTSRPASFIPKKELAVKKK